MKVMVFLHGTSIMHKSGKGQPREECVRQVMSGEESVLDFASYVPVGNAVEKLQKWEAQGAEIIYLSSHKKAENVDKDELVLRRFGFPEGRILYRQGGEDYGDIAERVLPDVLIEDDCESIGGEKEMTFPNINPEVKPGIRSIVVKEFEGIDHLPDNLFNLK